MCAVVFVFDKFQILPFSREHWTVAENGKMKRSECFIKSFGVSVSA